MFARFLFILFRFMCLLENLLFSFLWTGHCTLHFANIKFVVNIHSSNYNHLIIWRSGRLGHGLKQQAHLFCLIPLSVFWGLVQWHLHTWLYTAHSLIFPRNIYCTVKSRKQYTLTWSLYSSGKRQNKEKLVINNSFREPRVSGWVSPSDSLSESSF